MIPAPAKDSAPLSGEPGSATSLPVSSPTTSSRAQAEADVRHRGPCRLVPADQGQRARESKPGQWLIRQPSGHQAANNGTKPVVILLSTSSSGRRPSRLIP